MNQPIGSDADCITKMKQPQLTGRKDDKEQHAHSSVFSLLSTRADAAGGCTSAHTGGAHRVTLTSTHRAREGGVTLRREPVLVCFTLDDLLLFISVFNQNFTG